MSAFGIWAKIDDPKRITWTVTTDWAELRIGEIELLLSPDALTALITTATAARTGMDTVAADDEIILEAAPQHNPSGGPVIGKQTSEFIASPPQPLTVAEAKPEVVAGGSTDVDRRPRCSAADICALIISRLDAAPIGETAGAVHTYGARPGDIELLPPPTRTTIVVAAGDAARWFEIAVREVDPANPDLPGLALDPEIMTALSHRANLPSTVGLFG